MTWVKGVSGNPNGRPKKPTIDVQDAARDYTLPMVKVLAQIALDDSQPGAARVTAANALLDRGHGKPKQQVEASVAHYNIQELHLLAMKGCNPVELLAPPERVDIQVTDIVEGDACE